MSFNVVCYKSSADVKELNKTPYLSGSNTITGTLKDETSIINPVIIVAQTAPISFNYCYIPVFNRYYFVDGFNSVRNGLWEVDLTEDVLMTYKDAILQCEGFIDRCESGYNRDIADQNRAVLSKPTITKVSVPNDVFTSVGDYLITGFEIRITEA